MKDRSVVVAPNAGFCPGVRKAIDRVLELSKAGKKPIYTVGPLIHNNQVMAMLEAKGISSIENLTEVKDKNGVLVIRAHGITPDFMEELRSCGMEIVDLTCPLVRKAHNVIKQFAQKGYETVIAGDAGHAEVIGLLGYARGRGVAVANKEEARGLKNFDKVNVVAQTTQKPEVFSAIAAIIKSKASECQISDTICPPTKQRQKETLELAKDASLVIVAGGRHSANTNRLAKLCEELCHDVLRIESVDELSRETKLPSGKIFITAGASTPKEIVEDIARKTREIRKINRK